VCGYYDRLIGFLDHAVEQQFIKPENRRMIEIDETAEGLLDRLGPRRTR
jgi:predicted Rossmann-fold nucleotide-binding protein